LKQPNPKNFIHLLACGFGSGLAKKAPGTWGTVAAVILWWPLSYLSLFAYACVLIIAILVGILLCDKCSKDLGVHDHSAIVWDEFCGYWLTMLLAPQSLIWAIYGFILFRIFDIWKPWPISWIDRHVKGGLGIMVDDLIAGIFAGIILMVTVAIPHFKDFLCLTQVLLNIQHTGLVIV